MAGDTLLPIGLGTLMPLRIGARQSRRLTGRFRILLVESIAKVGNHDTVVENVETANAQIVTFNEPRLQQAVQTIRAQLVNLPSSTEQTEAVVRRELVFYRNMLDACMRRLGTVENNIRVLNEMNTRVMGQLADLEGHVDDAADMIQVVQQNPRGPQEKAKRRIRPNPGDRSAQNPAPSARPGRGVSLTDHVFEDSRRINASDQPQVNRRSVSPSVRSRVDAGSHANRRPISPVRERGDSRSRRALQMQDRSYSPPRRTRDG